MVEVAITLPIFFTFIFGIVEYGRLQMVSNMLQTACRTAARYGSTENVTTQQTELRVADIASAAIDTTNLNVTVKNAAVFDTAGPYPSTSAGYNALADIELNDAQPRELFLVRASIPYNEVALIPFSILDGVTLTGQALVRHE